MNEAEKLISQLKKQYRQTWHGQLAWQLGKIAKLSFLALFATACITGTGWMLISFARFIGG